MTLPIMQPVLDDLRNAAQIATAWAPAAMRGEEGHAFADIARLLRSALGKLAEPNLEATQAAATMLREADGADVARYARDVAAVILTAQLQGITPETWETV